MIKKLLFWNFWDEKWYFLSQKVYGKMIFTGFWKVFLLNFSVMWNKVSFESRSWWKRWYLLITENFLFWTFRWWEIRSFFMSRGWWKDDIYLVFLRFPWYSRTWEIRLFVQWWLRTLGNEYANVLLLFIYFLLYEFPNFISSLYWLIGISPNDLLVKFIKFEMLLIFSLSSHIV